MFYAVFPINIDKYFKYFKNAVITQSQTARRINEKI